MTACVPAAISLLATVADSTAGPPADRDGEGEAEGEAEAEWRRLDDGCGAVGVTCPGDVLGRPLAGAVWREILRDGFGWARDPGPGTPNTPNASFAKCWMGVGRTAA